MNALGVFTLKSFGISLDKSKDIPVERVTANKSFKKNNENDGPSNEITINKDSISGYYRTDINLHELNDFIIKIINNRTNDDIIHFENIKTAEIFKIKSSQSKNEREASVRNINNANHEILQCKNNINKIKYMTSVNSILDEYSKIGVLKQYVTFDKGIVTHNIEENKEKRAYRLSLIEKFLDIANQYVYINISKKIDFNGCPSCGYPLPKVDNNDGNNPNCIKCETEIVQLSTYIPDGESISTKKSVGGNSDGRNNFIKDLSRYQGKSKNGKLPNNLKQSLDDHFNMIGFPNGDEIKVKNLISRTNKDLMYRALKTIGMSKLYKDINLICHFYWGCELLNLEQVEDEIMKRYDQIYENYNIIKEESKDERSSCLNSQYVLWWILDSMDYECNPADFKIPKTPDIFEYYEKMRQEISRRLNWKYIPLKIDCIC